jgi:hypothetical protein
MMKGSETASVESMETNSDEGNDAILYDGEFAILAATLEYESGGAVVPQQQQQQQQQQTLQHLPATAGSGKPLHRLTSQRVEPMYGCPLSPEEAVSLLPPAGDSPGLVWHATVVPDNFCRNGQLTLRGLNKRDFDLESGTIKSRRPSLPVTISDLFSSLTKIDSGPDGGGPRYIFHGVLNGWPSLQTFELIQIEKKRSIGPLTPPDYMNSSRLTWQHYWGIKKEGREGISPEIKDKDKIYRAKLRGASWTSMGWYGRIRNGMEWVSLLEFCVAN